MTKHTAKGVLGHQFDQDSRRLNACKSILEEAYAKIDDMDCDDLKTMIQNAIERAADLRCAADDEFDSKR